MMCTVFNVLECTLVHKWHRTLFYHVFANDVYFVVYTTCHLSEFILAMRMTPMKRVDISDKAPIILQIKHKKNKIEGQNIYVCINQNTW